MEFYFMVHPNEKVMMKKYALSLCLLFCSLVSFCQSKLVGKYKDYFGNTIEIKNDSTFYYTWRFDLMYSWSQGKWTVANDTVYLKIDKPTNISDATPNLHPCPDKLFYKRGKLLLIANNGKLIKKKIRGFWTTKKWPRWYFKNNGL